MMQQFPTEIQDFAIRFAAMQAKRHAADYDPEPADPFYKSEIETDIVMARDAIKKFHSVNLRDRRAFAAYIALAKKAR